MAEGGANPIRIGDRLHRYFDPDGYFAGYVSEIHNKVNDRGVICLVLYFVVYEDGDKEYLTE